MSFRLHSPDPLDVGLGESTPDTVVCPVSVLSASDDFFYLYLKVIFSFNFFFHVNFSMRGIL